MRWFVIVLLFVLAGCGGAGDQGGDTSTGGSTVPSSAALPTDPVLISFLESVQASSIPAVAATAEYVDRVVLSEAAGGIGGNLVIVSTYMPGEQDQNTVESLCASGELWALDNAPEVLVSVASVDYSTTFVNCSTD